MIILSESRIFRRLRFSLLFQDGKVIPCCKILDTEK